MFCLDKTFCVGKHKNTEYDTVVYDGPKLSSKLLFIYSPNSDRFYIFTFHKVV